MAILDEVGPAYDHAKALIQERNKVYQDSWKEEGLGSHVNSVWKKANYLRMMYESGQWKENPEKFLEDCLDEMNYSAFTYITAGKELAK